MFNRIFSVLDINETHKFIWILGYLLIFPSIMGLVLTKNTNI